MLQPMRHERGCAGVCWLVILACCLLCNLSSAQPEGSPLKPTSKAVEASGAGAGAEAAECSLYLLGSGKDRISHAGMRCTGPRPTIALDVRRLAGSQTNFTGFDITSRGCGTSVRATRCRMTICGGRLVLRDSSVLGIQSNGSLVAGSVVCVAGDSRVEVHNSKFAENYETPLAVLDRAHLLLYASTVSDNSANGSGGGLYMEGYANVTITGKSRVLGNKASVDGGGLSAEDNVTCRVDGSSSVSGNSAGSAGGGVYVSSNATMTIAGGSSIDNNTAAMYGGGVDVNSGGVVTVTGGSRVHSNNAHIDGGGLSVRSGARLTISNQSTVLYNVCKRNSTQAGGSLVGGLGGGIGGGISVDVVGGSGFDERGSRVGNRPIQAEDRPLLVLALFTVLQKAFLESYKAALTGRPYRRDIPSHVTISNSTIANNTSIAAPGGGIAVDGNGTVELVNGAVISHNSAVNSSGGGAVLLGNGTLRSDDSVLFLNNIASKGYIGSTIAAFDNSTLQLHGSLTKCSAGVYLGWPTCRAGEVLQHDMCICCQQHTFSFTNVACHQCPRNANCEGSVVEPLPGYWSSAPTSVQMHRCPLSTVACNYTCATSDLQPAVQCNEAEGYTGPLCGACKLPGFGMLSPFRCGRCMQPRVQLGLYLLLSSVSVGFVSSTVHATWRDNVTGKKVVLDTDLIKVLVQFLQYAVIIGSVAVPWPLFDVQRWFMAVNIVFAVGSGQALSLDCWLYHYIPQGKLPLAMRRQLVYFLAPVLVLLAVVGVQWVAWALIRFLVPLVFRREEGTAPPSPWLVVRQLPVTLLVLTFYAYPTLLRAALSFFACLVIDRVHPEVFLPSGATAPLNHTHGYWVSDIQQQCFTGYHRAWALGLGVPSVLLWCIAVPVALGVGLFLFRAKAGQDSFREHFGFLYRSYRPERMWWEAVWAARTVILTCISVFSFQMERYFAVLSLLVVFLVSAALQIIFQPYAFAKLHRMHMVSTSCLLATTLGALAMFAYEIQESTAEKLRIAIAVLVMLVNVAFVGWCLWKLVPVVRNWSVATFKAVKAGVLWVVAAVMGCAGHKRAGQGRGRKRRGGV